MRSLKRAEILERKKRALAFAKQNNKLPNGKIIKKLMQEFQYSYSSARNILAESGANSKTKRKWKNYDKNTGEGLRKYLDQQEHEEQKALERKRLEKEHREKFQF